MFQGFWGTEPGLQKDMWEEMWVGRTLIFSGARNRLKRLVAGGGFEPPTFGL